MDVIARSITIFYTLERIYGRTFSLAGRRSIFFSFNGSAWFSSAGAVSANEALVGKLPDYGAAGRNRGL